VNDERGLAHAAAVLALLPLAALVAVFGALGLGYAATAYRVWSLAQFAAGQLSAAGGWNAAVEGRVVRFATDSGLDAARLCLPAGQPGLGGGYLPYGTAAELTVDYRMVARLPVGGAVTIPVRATAAWMSHHVPQLTVAPATAPSGGCRSPAPGARGAA
jgi:hypothetical protein